MRDEFLSVRQKPQLIKKKISRAIRIGDENTPSRSREEILLWHYGSNKEF